MSQPTPESLASCGSEHAQQTALFCWAAMPTIQRLYPELKFMFAIPNGGERNKIVAGNLKAEGVRAGVWDIFLPIPVRLSHGMFIEMKVDNNGLTAEQKTFGLFILANHYETAVCYNWQDAVRAIVQYLGARDSKIDLIKTFY
jgi:hypothetical protein